MKFALRLAMCLVLASSVSGAQTPVGTVTGTVRDVSGLPIRDAVVVIDAETASQRTRTDVTGRFSIDRVPVGRRQLQVVRIGFGPHRSFIDVTESGIDIAITMQHIAIVLDTVSVRVSRTGIHGVVSTRGISLLPHAPRPLRGAIVEVLNSPYRTTTGGDGRFSLGALGEGGYSLLVRLDRYPHRIVAAYVPADGGVDINIVLDSTIADWQRRDDIELREISSRLRAANNPSAFVSTAELVGPENMTLKEALRDAPSALSRGITVRDDVTCVYLDGQPRPGMVAGDIIADDVQAVEVYGIDGRGFAMVPRTPSWPKGTFCGTGVREGPNWVPPGTRPQFDNVARTLVIWTKKGRGR